MGAAGPDGLSRTAFSRARFFITKARACPPDERADFEAYIETVIIWARAAVHRFEERHKKHRLWKGWWTGMLKDPACTFFRTHRDRVLKEASIRIGQKIFVGPIGAGPGWVDPDMPKSAAAFYFFDQNACPVRTVEAHLDSLQAELERAAEMFRQP